MKRFASDRVAGLMERMGLEGDVAIESRLVSKTIENAQSRVEGYNFDIRKRVVEYDDVINKQRETIYAERDKVLRNEDLTETVRDFVDDEIELTGRAAPGPVVDDWDLEDLARGLEGLGIEAMASGRGPRRHRQPRADRRDACWTPPTRCSSRRSSSTARRSGRWSSGWSCCAPSTRCGSST